MSLYDVLKKRGYTFRQHLEEEGWGWFTPTVVDMDVYQRDALKHGGINGLKKYLDGKVYRPPWGLWTFPALDIEAPLPRHPDLVLARGGKAIAQIVAPRRNKLLWAMAGEFARAVWNQCRLKLTVTDEVDAGTELLEKKGLVLFGGSHENKLAMKLALRHRTFFVDAGVPGEGGWIVTTHAGLNTAGNNVLQVTAGAEHRKKVMQVMINALATDGDDLLMRHIHCIGHGREMAKHFPSWDAFVAGLPKRIYQFQGKTVEMPRDIKSISELLAQGLDSGGLEKGYYNVAPVDIANDCARYYQLSADLRALQLFRELLFRLCDYYLKKPGGACYPADLDFRLGLLVLNFARFEHQPLFNDDERLILANLLLACTRSIYEYAMKIWPAKRVSDTRHNHQTFPALSLLFAADYFSRFNLPYIKDWRAYSDEVFSGQVWRRSKQCENSRSYEPFVFEHAAAYSAFNGKGLSMFEGDCFKKLVERQMAATDNFFRMVDYGDTGIHLDPVDSVSARMLAIYTDGPVRWFAGEGFARKPNYIGGSFLDFPGLRSARVKAPPAAGAWECMPLELVFISEVAPGFPREHAFDKLAFRTGWGNDDHYLLLEGVGGKVSHSHRESNGIVRLNHLGRHWIVSNGYGRRIGVTNVSKSFSTRELGPVDHNMLIFKRAGKIAIDLSLGALLQRGQKGNLLYATAAQLDYCGVNWFRTLVIAANQFTLVVDRIEVVKPGLDAGHVEWNCLGDSKTNPNGFRLEQKGVFMDIISASNWRAEQGVADQSACWKGILSGTEYPYATFPLTKLVFRMPSTEVGKTYCLGTLFAATKSTRCAYVVSQEGGSITVAGPHKGLSGLRVADRDLAISIKGNKCEVRFDAVPEVSKKLTDWAKNRDHDLNPY
jgi:hypothetical protein